ncbi:hypothetical protein MF628_000927 [Paenibacillus polymyxa]|uniref:hypothetical protein n=1 Tax=Paenibacillus TaxID=44249 RepID=UPI0020247B01|nr:hypothetical protein [Paenibacillus polymyxa]URJ46397.1 hypothetical protein MF628_000927 [Paenibacillus polymyxa]
MTDKPDFKKGDPVQHKTKKLYEARFEKWSKSGKRIGVRHNYVWPYGAGYAVDYFDPKNIVRDKL